MGKIDLFTIELQKQVPIYFGGESVVGTVKIQLKERIKIKALKLTVKGGAEVRWRESHSSGKSTTTVTYSAYEIYMNSITSLMNKQTNDDDLYLEAGNHSLPFNVILPPQLPTSFESYFGNIRYSIRATIDIPWSFDKHALRPFMVINHYDLNAFPALRQSQGTTVDKQVGSLCCKAGTISAFFATSKTGYVPGEQIQFGIKIDNKSSREIKLIKLELFEQILFHSTRKTKVSKRSLGEIRCPRRIKPQELYEWTNRETLLTIPPIVSSSNGLCKIIQISYFLNMNFNPSGLSMSTDLQIPIVIGTIPFKDQQQQQSTNLSQQFQYMASVFKENFDYQEDLKGEIIESGQNFTPVYPFYNDLSAATR